VSSYDDTKIFDSGIADRSTELSDQGRDPMPLS